MSQAPLLAVRVLEHIACRKGCVDGGACLHGLPLAVLICDWWCVLQWLHRREQCRVVARGPCAMWGIHMQIFGCDVLCLAILVSLQPFITVALQVMLWGLQDSAQQVGQRWETQEKCHWIDVSHLLNLPVLKNALQVRKLGWQGDCSSSRCVLQDTSLRACPHP